MIWIYTVESWIVLILMTLFALFILSSYDSVRDWCKVRLAKRIEQRLRGKRVTRPERALLLAAKSRRPGFLAYFCTVVPAAFVCGLGYVMFIGFQIAADDLSNELNRQWRLGYPIEMMSSNQIAYYGEDYKIVVEPTPHVTKSELIVAGGDAPWDRQTQPNAVIWLRKDVYDGEPYLVRTIYRN